MEETQKQMRVRVIRTHEMAYDLCMQVKKQVDTERILHPAEIVSVFAQACVLAIVAGHDADPEFGSDLAGRVFRDLLDKLNTFGISIPDWGLEKPEPYVRTPSSESEH